MELGFVAVIVQLIFLECILSLDNAAVIGAMVAPLPNDQTTPWPKALRPIFGWTDKYLGSQREAALKVGLFGAYAGRALMLVLASLIMQVAWVQILGALYLLHLALDHFAEVYHKQRRADAGVDEAAHQAIHARGFWGIVLALNLADMAFSLDNVVAAVALTDELWVVMLGVAIGILVMRFAAQIFSRLVQWEPALEHGAYLLLLAIGVQFILKFFHIEIHEATQFAISVGILVLTVLFPRTAILKPLGFIFKPFMLLSAGIESVVGFLMSIVTAPLRIFAVR